MEKSTFKKFQKDRNNLPIYAHRDQLLEAIDNNQILIIVGETGSGKTTQIPQYLHAAGYTRQGKVGCTQPWQVAARSVAVRVSKEMGVKLGREVGYSSSFNDCTSKMTVLKYTTDDMLLQELHEDADLAEYSVVMVDEAQERTLSTNILFGMVKRISQSRPALKFIISSSNLDDAVKFSDYFDSAQVVQIDGRRFPVGVHRTKAQAERTDLAIGILTIQKLGFQLEDFEFVDPQPQEAVNKSLELLCLLGALDQSTHLTEVGSIMEEFPLDAMTSKMVIASEKYECSRDIITISAMLSIRESVFCWPKNKEEEAKKAHEKFLEGNASDHISLLKIYSSWKEHNYDTQWGWDNFIRVRSMRRARDLKDHLEGISRRVGIELMSNSNDLVAIKKAITEGFFPHAARLTIDGYRLVKNPQKVYIHPTSGLAEEHPIPRFLIYHELLSTTNKEYMRQVTEVKAEWLFEIASHYYGKDLEDQPKMPRGAGCASSATSYGQTLSVWAMS